MINRIEMLSTGVRTGIGIKVFGPDLDTVDRVCKQVEAAVKPVPGARDVVATPIMGKGYLDVVIDREKAARYGVTEPSAGRAGVGVNPRRGRPGRGGAGFRAGGTTAVRS